MIVICTRCQAKFRVADEKIGPRGAKVRCSKCQTIFLVHRDLGSVSLDGQTAAAPPAGDAPGSHRAAAPGSHRAAAPSAFSAPEPRPSVVPPPLPPPLPSQRAQAADPFGGSDPFAAAADPFARAAPSAADPFGDDPFGIASDAAPGTASLHAAGDPFASAPAAKPSAPLTDLSALLAPSAAAASSAPADLIGDFADDDAAGGGLALEDRDTPPPFARGGVPPDASGPLGAFDPGGADLAAFGAGPDAPLALATEGTPSPAPLPYAAPPRRAAAAAPAARGAAVLSPAPPAEPAAPDRIPGGRGSRLRAAIVNAVALAVLLLVSLALAVVWRSDQPLSGGALRPSAILALLGRSAATPEPFAVADLSNGAYDREAAPPLLFVRGNVVSRAPAPVGAVRVSVELLRGGEVVARGAALAGAVPTPEELYRSADAASIAAIARHARARAPRQVRPGDVVPFLVAISDYPADLGGTTLRAEAAPEHDRP